MSQAMTRYVEGYVERLHLWSVTVDQWARFCLGGLGRSYPMLDLRITTCIAILRHQTPGMLGLLNIRCLPKGRIQTAQ